MTRLYRVTARFRMRCGSDGAGLAGLIASAVTERSEGLRRSGRKSALAGRRRHTPLVCHGTKPDNCNIYCETTEPCWYIYAPWSDHRDVIALRSRRVILVGKLTGTIHYDGSVGDEG